jgi:flavin reductase (DIM6/NTAB) family NADH-FMN oxidoreductase RutF
VSENPETSTLHAQRSTLNPDFAGFDAAELSRADAHRLLLYCVAPRPIALTSTLSADGAPNLAPFSYFMAGGANPLSVVISPTSDRDGKPKHTLRNIEATGEYVINVVTHAMREQVNVASAEYPDGVSEWQKCGLTPAPAARVRPARVLESPLAIECRLFQVVPHGRGPQSANYVIGEVVYIHVARAIMPEGVIDARLVDYISRMGADWYARTEPEVMFEMPRPPRIEGNP